MKFIHAADLHLDSPLRNLQRYEGAPVEAIRSASRRALENLVELAIGQQVDFVLLAGDLFDGDWTDYNSGLFFNRQMVRLGEAKIPVITISGNHDAQGKMTRSLTMPDNVHEMRTDAAHTLRAEQLGIEQPVAIHGRGFANAVVNENVVPDYPEPVPGCFNIGLLHTSLESPAGEHARYAPCSLADLTSKGYDYWALGHVHHRSENQHGNCWIVYPGNLQGRHIRETEAKGCYLVTVDAWQNVTLDFHPLDVFRWYHCRVDIAGCETPADALDCFAEALQVHVTDAEDRPLAVRVTLRGRCAAHRHLSGDRERYLNELRAKATEVGSARVWLEKIRIETQLPIDTDALLDEGPLSELSHVIEQLKQDDDLLAELTEAWTSLENRLPSDLRRADSPEATRLSDPAYLRNLLPDVESLLIDRLSRVKTDS